MKMLIVVYRYYLEEQFHALMKQTGVHGFSEIPVVLGGGETGKVMDSRIWPGHNACLFAALPEDELSRVVTAVQQLAESQRGQSGNPAPIRAFVLPCEQVV
jgi:hypothetical protein